MMFSRGQKKNLITLREGKSRFLIVVKNSSRETKATVEKMVSALKAYTPLVLSMTLDNGTEFCAHEQLQRSLGIKTYFCEPYKSHQKGSIENGNGLLREYFPRNTQEALTQWQVNGVLKKVNGRPMKCLDYRTPAEVFGELLKKAGSL